MKFRLSFTIIFLICIMHAKAMLPELPSDSARLTLQGIIDPDSLLEDFDMNTKPTTKPVTTLPKTPLLLAHPKNYKKSVDTSTEKQAFDSLINEKSIQSKNMPDCFTLPSSIKPIKIDSLILNANPFFIDLVYENIPLNFDWNLQPDYCKIYHGKKATTLSTNIYLPIKTQTPEQFLDDLRKEARTYINRKAIHLYAFRYDQLPDPSVNKSHIIKGKQLETINIIENDDVLSNKDRRMSLKKIQFSRWQHTASNLLQFSENAVSKNWYQGGSNNLAVLGILTGTLNYDDKKFIQWDNNAEWRMGFNTVEGDSIHPLTPNDDVFKINSKLGIKAGGNWFYSGSVDFSTQFLNSYKGVNSTVMKTSFLTPVRVNIGVGLDYKYKKLLSLMVSPVSYKYIYLNEKDPKKISPNLFGIKEGHILSELGSSFKAVLSYAPVHEIQFDSKLSFYTNYKKVEIDWEMVCNLTINRFLSTRISFNPRYDNTVIEKTGEQAKIQYKQMLSVGFSHKFR